MAKNPITILGNGVALGYAPAGPAHEPTEDLAYMRTLCGIEICSPANNEVTKNLVDLTCEDPKLRYIRLERKYPVKLDDVYKEFRPLTKNSLYAGLFSTKLRIPETLETRQTGNKKICILSSGYMLGRAFDVGEKFSSLGYETCIIDLWRIKPIRASIFVPSVSSYDLLVTLEEQTLSGGLGSAVSEMVMDEVINKEVLRIGLPEGYIFDNGDREHLLNKNGLSVESIVEKIRARLPEQ